MYFLSREVTRRWTSDSMRAFSASVWLLVVYSAGLALGETPLDEVEALAALPVGGGTYHFDRRVLPWRFCSKKNRIWGCK